MFPDQDPRKQRSSRDPSSKADGADVLAPEEVRRIRIECERLAGLGQTGLAMGQLERVIGAADRQGASDPDWVVRAVELRQVAARIARRAGSLAEALQLTDEAIALQERIAGRHDRSVFTLHGHRAELLLEMGQPHKALEAYAAVRQWSLSAYGHPVEGVLAELGIAAVHATSGNGGECAASLEAAAEMFDDVATNDSMGELARAIRRGARLFAAGQHFELGVELASLSTKYLERGGALEGGRDLAHAMLFEASLAMKAGQFTRGMGVQQDLLGVLDRKIGEASLESAALRKRMARDAFERGDLETAERLLLRNVNLSTADPTSLDMVGRGRSLQEFYLRVGRQMSAAYASLAIERGLVLRNQISNYMKGPRGKKSPTESESRPEGSGRSGVVARAVKEVRARLREASILLKVGDKGPNFHGQLNAAEERAIEMPKRLYESALTAIERMRGMGASSPEEIEAAVATSARRMREFEKNFGRSREVSRAARHACHAKLLAGAGDAEGAGQWMEAGLEILKGRGLRHSYMYAHCLRDYAELLPAGHFDAERMMAEARRITTLIRRRDIGPRDDLGQREG